MPRKTKPSRYRAGGFLPEQALRDDQERALRSIHDSDTFIQRAQHIAAWYEVLLSDDRQRPKPAQLLAAMDDLQEKINALLSAFQHLDSETSALIRETTALHSGTATAAALLDKEHRDYLRWLEGMIELTRQRFDGSLTSKRRASRALTHMVAELLLDNGLPLKKYEGGEFCQTIRILSDEKASTVRNWVWEYLDNPF